MKAQPKKYNSFIMPNTGNVLQFFPDEQFEVKEINGQDVWLHHGNCRDVAFKFKLSEVDLIN